MVELAKDELIFLVPIGNKYAQYKFKPANKMINLLKEYKIPYKTGDKPFKFWRLKFIDAEHTNINYYKVKRNNADGRGTHYTFAFTSDVIDKVLNQYSVPYEKDVHEKIYKKGKEETKEKEVKKERKDKVKRSETISYKDIQYRTKLEDWYVCNRLGYSLDQWLDIKYGRKKIPKSKQELVNHLFTHIPEALEEQAKEKVKIDAWYNANWHNVDTMCKEFLVSNKQVAQDIGVSTKLITAIKNHKLKSGADTIYLTYYYFQNDSNRRIDKRGRRKPGRKPSKPLLTVDEVVKEEPINEFVELLTEDKDGNLVVNEEVVNEKPKESTLDIALKYAESVNKSNVALAQAVEESEKTLEKLKNKGAYQNESDELISLRKEVLELRAELARYKYLIDSSINKQ